MYNYDPTRRPPAIVSLLIIVGMIVGMAYSLKEFAEHLNK